MKKQRIDWRRRHDFVMFLVLAVPNLLLLAFFVYRPLFVNMKISLLDWTLGSANAKNIGLGNYLEFFTDPSALQVLKITALFTVGTVGGSMVLGLLIAVVLNRGLIGTMFSRSAIFAPYVLSGVGVGLVWLFIFDPAYGILSWVMRTLGLPVLQWINDPKLALIMLIIVYVWKNLGYCAVVYLAGLQSIPKELLEAASLDGASEKYLFWHIKFPLLSPTTFFLSITCILSSLQAFDLIKIMTPTGNGTSTLVYESYRQAFQGYNRAGYAATISTVLFVILLIVSLTQLLYLEKKVHYA